ncbi:hypothetical protein CEXT_407131 [Caerostris extrusa]|uniref:Secreted protein n=1 Tax=Caerostris extrusa TaxID=172846 RepID=A0AAV4QCS2_CAEEX|nr:hypothetical protein CEXT_407131 [Caerostris extrusa]
MSPGLFLLWTRAFSFNHNFCQTTRASEKKKKSLGVWWQRRGGEGGGQENVTEYKFCVVHRKMSDGVEKLPSPLHTLEVEERARVLRKLFLFAFTTGGKVS